MKKIIIGKRRRPRPIEISRIACDIKYQIIETLGRKFHLTSNLMLVSLFSLSDSEGGEFTTFHYFYKLDKGEEKGWDD